MRSASGRKRARDASLGSGLIASSGAQRYALDTDEPMKVSQRARTATGARTETGATRSRTRTGTGRTRTATRRTLTSRVDDVYIVAIIENRNKEVGLAAYNLRSFHVELRQFADTNCFVNTMTVLTVFNPVEIVLSQSSAGGSLDRAILENAYLADVRCSFVGRKYFNETQGAILCERLSAEQCPNLAISSTLPRYLALASTAALVKYVEHIQAVILEPGSMRINLSPNDGTLFLDVATIEAVELIRSSRVARDGNAAGSFAKNDSLLAVIDKTKTRPGKRFLRRTLLEPPGDIGTILARQHVVEELSGNEEGYFAICRALSSFPDLESVLASLLAKEAALVAQFSRAVPPASIEQQQERDSSVPSQQIGAAGPSRTPLKSRLNTAGCSASAAAVYFQQQPFQEITGRFASVSASAVRRTDQKWTAGATLACGIATTMSLPSINIIRNMLKVKAAMDALGPILQVIEAGSSAILLAIAGSLQSTALVDLSNEIVTVLDESAAPSSRTEHMRLQGAFAVRNGRNGHLDVARKTLSENIEDMHELLERMREQLDQPKLALTMNAKRGYHFSINAKLISTGKLGEEFIQVQATGKVVRFSTNALSELNSRVNESLVEIWQLTDRELASLLDVIWAKDTVSALHRLCDSIALLDAMTALVSYCSLSPVATVRPVFTDGGPIAVKSGHHPILVARSPHDAVPNDVFLSETSAMHIITGRNNSGKSTFLRSVALNTILAHTGCNVPAEFASFRLLKNVCTRFNTSDDINSQLSHHSKEMQEIGAILSATTLTSRRKEYPQSLVLVDELGRSTNTVDGFSIAYAVAERLASTPNVLTLFTTHFAALGSLQFSLPVVHGFHLATTTATAHGQPRLTAAQQAYHDQQREQRRQREAEKVAKDCNSDGAAAAVSQEFDDRPLPAFTYKVVEGELLDESYGIDTARAAGFSERVLASARSIRDALPARRLTSAEAFTATHHATSGVDGMGATRSRNAVRIAEKLSHLRGAMSKMDDAGLHQALRGLQAEVSAAGARRRAQSGSAREGCRRGSRG